jgi:hypothetical protein
MGTSSPASDGRTAAEIIPVGWCVPGAQATTGVPELVAIAAAAAFIRPE